MTRMLSSSIRLCKRALEHRQLTEPLTVAFFLDRGSRPIVRMLFSPSRISSTINLLLKHMNINLIQQIDFQGRSGLSRSLAARFTESHFLYAFMGLAIFSGLFVAMNFYSLLSFTGFCQVFFFFTAAYIAWVLRETSSLRVHLHGERLIYEIKNMGGVSFTFSEIQSLRIGNSQGVYGMFITIKSGMHYHFPIHLERLDYVLDSLHYHRSDLTQTPEFKKFRRRALVIDHVLAHNRSYLSRAHVKAISFFLIYPFYIQHTLKRLQADPSLVRRDMEYEKKMETLAHKFNIGISLATLAVVVLWRMHI
jgi:hypothetical protein